MGKKAQTFRAGVGIVVIDAQGNVLALERADVEGQWQMPQGGLDHDEEPLAAAKRELWEETGLSEDEVQVLAEHPEWLVYELPTYSKKHGRGQAQRWFLFQVKESRTAIDLQRAKSKEFRHWKWTTLTRLRDETVEFRQTVYGKLAEYFAEHLALD